MKSKPASRRVRENFFIYLNMYLLPVMLSSQSLAPAPISKGDTLHIDVWSDVVCPFCYIGKRNLEHALKQWKPQANVQISIKSFLLNPDLKTDTSRRFETYLAEVKGMEVNDVRILNQRVTQMATQAGLEFHMDKLQIANSLRAHQLLKFAHAAGKQGEALEKLFAANFTEGLNIDDPMLLVNITESCGLSNAAFLRALESETYIPAIRAEMDEAQRLGITSVPYFVFNKQFAISGAQESTVFLKFLQEKFQ